MYQIKLEFPGMIKAYKKSKANSKEYLRSSHQDLWARRTVEKVNEVGKPEKPLERVRIHCVRYSPFEVSEDTVVRTFRPLLAGLVRAGVIYNETIAEISYDVGYSLAKETKMVMEISSS